MIYRIFLRKAFVRSALGVEYSFNLVAGRCLNNPVDANIGIEHILKFVGFCRQIFFSSEDLRCSFCFVVQRSVFA